MNLKGLVGRLGPSARAALEGAAGVTFSRTHYDIEPEHLLLKLVEQTDTDVGAILRDAGIDEAKLAAQVDAVLDGFRTGNGRPPALSPRLVRLIREAWLDASINRDAAVLRTGHLLLTLLGDDDLADDLRQRIPLLRQIAVPALADGFDRITGGSGEARGAVPAGAAATPDAAAARGGKALDAYCIDLTQRARDGAIDPVIGRDAEIRQVIDILTRRRQNNPILTGEAGVGKTAVVEGLALRLVAGDVPPLLDGVRLLSLDLGLLQAGAGVRGEFENRLKSVIEEVRASTTPIVMFIDEAHTLVGAGGQEGQGDAANLLKPALARGELRTIAATTWAEYKKYFEKDAALTRRFQVVKVDEPSVDRAVEMMRGLVATLEAHHGVRIMDEAVRASVTLSHRYIFGRQLPDKSISLLDTACARVAMSQAATPAELEDVVRGLDALAVERRILDRERAGGGDHGARLATLDETEATLAARRQALEARWTRERELVAAMRADRDALETAEGDAATAHRDALAAKRAELTLLAGERPMLFDVVDATAVADVVAQWTGIPVGRMLSDELRAVIDLEGIMAGRIRGQQQALSAIGRAMRVSRAGLSDPRKPTGVFLMVGTSGVGKTETALTLADLFYGGPQNLTTINMSEFKEEHKVSMLLGAPPGYVGFGEGGVLTEAVRRKPFSVILLDEMEKAHPGVQDVFYQLFDTGRIKDGQGRDIDFRNAMILMTSNAGSETIEKLFDDPDTAPEGEALAAALRPALLEHFRPAFLGRVTVVPYRPLDAGIIREIVALALTRLATRMRDSYGATLTWSDAVVSAIAARCTETQSGARNVEAVIAGTIAPELAGRILQARHDGASAQDVRLDADPLGELTYAVGKETTASHRDDRRGAA